MEELKEEWKLVNGYKISNYGVILGKKGSPLKLSKNKGGYIVCDLDFGHPYGKVKSLHRAVALVFIPNPENKSDVNHKDANKENCRVDNLEWNTRQENMTHSKINRLHPKTTYCCSIDSNGNITNTFNSIEDVRTFLQTNTSGMCKCLKGEIDSIHGYKIRIWIPETNSYVKTKYDDPNYEWKSTRHREILCEQNGKVYKTQMQASRELNISQSSISNNLLHGTKKCQYTFKYV